MGSGSKVFELNVHLWEFGRPQPRTMTVRERMEHVVKANAARSARRVAKWAAKKARTVFAHGGGEDAQAGASGAGGDQLSGI